MTLTALTVADAGKLGGAARAANLTPKQRVAAARRANRARWNKYYREHPERVRPTVDTATVMRSNGGKARARKLTKAQRVEIARGRRKRARGETDTREAPADRAQGGAGERETCALNSCLLNLVRL